jgi:PAS domain S-box-containing protein
MKRFSNLKITDVITITIGVIFIIVTALIVFLVNSSMKQQALMEAEAKARILIDRNLATHTYFSHIMKPRLFAWTAPFRTPEYFDPSWMSSTFAVREIHKYFNTLNPSGYYVKDAAIDARSPENEADAFERAFLDRLTKDTSLESYSAIRVLDGKPYLAVIKRGEVMEEGCLRCHSTPGNAPQDLLKHYDDKRSFHRSTGDVASAVSLRVPLSAAYEGASDVFVKLTILLVIVLAILFGVQTFLYRRFLIAPLGAIRDKAIDIVASERSLGEKIPAPIGRELRELTDAFNEMSVRLRFGRDDLENRVEQRTRDLETSNAQLVQEAHRRGIVEEVLRESEEKHRALLDGMPDIILRFDRDGRCLFSSRAVEEATGIPAAACLGRTPCELNFPEELCRFLEEALRGGIESGEHFEAEFPLEGKQGTAIYNWRFIPERDAQGAVKTLLSLGRDMTAHRRAERDYQTLFREMLDGFALHEILCDDAGLPVDYRFLAVNPAFERMTGLTAEAVTGRTVLEVMPETERRWIEIYGRVALTGEPAFFESYAQALDKYFVVTAFRPAPNSFACIFVDITERRRVEERLTEQLSELNRWHDVTMGRERRILELKREVNDLLARAGEPARYASAGPDGGEDEADPIPQGGKTDSGDGT